MDVCELSAFFNYYRETFLPDLYSFFTETPGTGGAAGFVKFLRVFEGCEFRVPKLEELQDLRRDVHVFKAMSEAAATPGNRAPTIRRLAEDYRTTPEEIVQVYNRMRVKFPKEPAKRKAEQHGEEENAASIW